MNASTNIPPAEPPRALIIGCGYLGARVGPLLAARGYRVTATTRSPARLEELAALGLEPAVLDLARPEASDAWGNRYAAAVYAVAPGRGDPDLGFHRGALECTRRLFAGPRPPPRFVYISSTGVHGEAGGAWVGEETPTRPDDERTRWIVRAEEDLRALTAREGLPAVVLRLSGLYGPGRSPVDWLRRPETLARIAAGSRDAWMNWIRIEDAAAAAVLAIELGRPGEIYQASDGTPVTRGEFYAEAARLAGLPLPAMRDGPDRGKRVTIEKARRELGFAPRFPSWREGLADLAGPAGEGT